MTKKQSDAPEVLADLVPAGVNAPPAQPASKPVKEATGKPETLVDLAPDLEASPAEPEFWFWCGMVPFEGMANAGLHVGGISFPILNEAVIKTGSGALGKTRRETRRGCVVRMTRAKLRQLAEAIRRSVLRPVRVSGLVEPGIAESTHKAPERTEYARVTIPSEADVEEARRQSGGRRRVQPFVPKPGDMALAAAIYVQWLDQHPPHWPTISDPAPRPVSETGIVVPPEGAIPIGPNERIANGSTTLARRDPTGPAAPRMMDVAEWEQEAADRQLKPPKGG